MLGYYTDTPTPKGDGVSRSVISVISADYNYGQYLSSSNQTITFEAVVNKV